MSSGNITSAMMGDYRPDLTRRAIIHIAQFITAILVSF